MGRNFSESTLEEFKNLLLSKRKEILKMYQNQKNEELDIEGDEVDLVQGILISSIGENISKMEARKLSRINDALVKIKDGTFGICDDCESLIGKKRLLARPEAEKCIACAEKDELEAKHYKNAL